MPTATNGVDAISTSLSRPPTKPAYSRLDGKATHLGGRLLQAEPPTGTHWWLLALASTASQTCWVSKASRKVGWQGSPLA